MMQQDPIEKITARVERFRESSKAHAIMVGLRDIQFLLSELAKAREELKHLSCPICGFDVDGNNWREKADRYREALMKIGNQVGAPTMQYEATVERQELLQRSEQISRTVRQALAGGEK